MDSENCITTEEIVNNEKKDCIEILKNIIENDDGVGSHMLK